MNTIFLKRTRTIKFFAPNSQRRRNHTIWTQFHKLFTVYSIVIIATPGSTFALPVAVTVIVAVPAPTRVTTPVCSPTVRIVSLPASAVKVKFLLSSLRYADPPYAGVRM